MTNTLSLPDNLAQRLADLQSIPKGEFELENGVSFGEETSSGTSTAFIP